MKKIAFAAMAAIILVSAFVGIRMYTVNATNDNRMYFDPTEKVYSPPYGGPLNFTYDLRMNTTHTDVSIWEAVLLWNPKVIRVLNVVYGTYFTNTTYLEDVSPYINPSGTGMTFGQYYSEKTLGEGNHDGLLATINFTFVAPAATAITFVNATITTDAFVTYVLDGQTGLVKSNRPHAEFWWYTNDTAGNVGQYNSTAHGPSPLANTPIYDGARNVYAGSTVYFNASTLTYDVTNMEWSGTAWALNASGIGISHYVWDFGDGYGTNDIRIDTTTGYANGSTVLSLDTDVGNALFAFKTFEKYYANLTGSGYVYHDPIINDTNTDGKYESANDTILYNPNAITILENQTLKAFPSNVKHTGVTTAFASGNGIYKDLQLTTETGYGVVSANDVAIVSHVYQAYTNPGYTVSLTAYDASGDYWSSTWRYGGVRDDDFVPCYRDVGLVSIWPSLIPFQIWDNGTGGDAGDWWQFWNFDSTDFYYPSVTDPYWNYMMPDSWCSDAEVPVNSTVKQAWDLLGDWAGWGPGWNILVTANNYGSVKEKCLINLYAAAVTFKLSGAGISTYAPVQIADIEKIASWTYTLNAGVYGAGMIAPSGSGWALATNWMPTKNAAYIIYATIDIANGATGSEAVSSNNLFVLPQMCSNIAVWNFTGTADKEALVSPVKTYWNYLCDIRNVGSVSTTDLSPSLAWLGSNNLWKTYIPKSLP